MSERKAALTILCLASYEKGHEFLRECKRQGCRVLLLTSQSLRNAEFPREAIDEIFYMPDVNRKWNLDDTIAGVSYLAQRERIERIVPLDDFDLEKAAALREHLRVPGMGETMTRRFRDKLAMRQHARDAGLRVPDFSPVINDAALGEFVERAAPPYMLKPRSEAAAIGIKKIESRDEFWTTLDSLGDRRSYYVLERFVPGDIFHVDAITFRGEVRFAVASRYGKPPFTVAHEGGVFTTRTLASDSEDACKLLALNERWIRASGLPRGVTHTEFIKSHDDGEFHFLETAARVGGAHIAELVEAATGINLWAEWAKVEIAGSEGGYELPEARPDFAGLLVSLARQDAPDTSAYQDPEIFWRMSKKHHVGLIVSSPDERRVNELLESYARRFQEDFTAVQPALESSAELTQ